MADAGVELLEGYLRRKCYAQTGGLDDGGVMRKDVGDRERGSAIQLISKKGPGEMLERENMRPRYKGLRRLEGSSIGEKGAVSEALVASPMQPLIPYNPQICAALRRIVIGERGGSLERVGLAGPCRLSAFW